MQEGHVGHVTLIIILDLVNISQTPQISQAHSTAQVWTQESPNEEENEHVGTHWYSFTALNILIQPH